MVNLSMKSIDSGLTLTLTAYRSYDLFTLDETAGEVCDRKVFPFE